MLLDNGRLQGGGGRRLPVRRARRARVPRGGWAERHQARWGPGVGAARGGPRARRALVRQSRTGRNSHGEQCRGGGHCARPGCLL
eukprot:9310051-Alexandrium_andersonii.AAC.1